MVISRNTNHENNGLGLGNEGLYTSKGYERSSGDQLTSSVEDYLEIICRIEEEGLPTRVSLLAQSLHVRPFLTSKILGDLRAGGYTDFRKYGSIMVTNKGHEVGRCLLHRHQVLHDFFCTLNHADCELEQVEKIEHFINRRTVENTERIITFLREMPQNAIFKHALELYREILYNREYAK